MTSEIKDAINTIVYFETLPRTTSRFTPIGSSHVTVDEVRMFDKALRLVWNLDPSLQDEVEKEIKNKIKTILTQHLVGKV